MVKKVVIVLRDDLYEKIKQKFGPRGISKAVNQILSERVFQEKGMFGTMKRVNPIDLRDHWDHY